MGGRSMLGTGTRVRGARWQVQLLVAVILAASAGYMLVDPGRAERLAALVAGGYFLVDGIVYVLVRMGNPGTGRGAEADALRTGVGLLTAVLLFGLSFLQAITAVGVRLIVAIGGIPVGLLGLWLFLVTRRNGWRWGFAAGNVLVMLLGVLLLYTQFVDEFAFTNGVSIVAGALLVVAAGLAIIALVRARWARSVEPAA